MKRLTFALLSILAITACTDIKVFDKNRNGNDTVCNEMDDFPCSIETVDELWGSNYDYEDSVVYPKEYLLLDITMDGKPELVVRNVDEYKEMIFEIDNGVPSDFALVRDFYEYFSVVLDKGLFITTSQQSGHTWDQTAEKWENGYKIYSASLFESVSEEEDEEDLDYSIYQNGENKNITYEEYCEYADYDNQVKIDDLEGWKSIER